MEINPPTLTPLACHELSPAQLADAADAQLTVEIAEAQLRELHAKLERLIDAADGVQELLRELAGPSPSFVPQHLITMTQMGTGYFRQNKATLEALFRRRNQIAKDKP